VASIVQPAGLDAARYGGHSLRAGLATAAAAGEACGRAAGAPAKWPHSYVRPATLFTQNAAAYTPSGDCIAGKQADRPNNRSPVKSGN
jgi:hypothetical protein